MAQIFPQWTNRLPLFVGVVAVLTAIGGTGFFWYFGSPKFIDVGYRPVQPVAYSHKLHAGDLGLDCRYCHSRVESSAVAGVPPTQTCMNCHKLVKADSKKIAPVRQSFETGKPIEWIRVHKLPDYAYFDHSAHLNAGVGCASCHGNVAQMERVMQKKPLSMSWCLDCHRSPDQYLRPANEVTNMKWTPPPNQEEYAAAVKEKRRLAPPVDCTGCHR